jgi:hypothetical protein
VQHFINWASWWRCVSLEPRIWVVFSESFLAGRFWIWFWFYHCTYIMASLSIICICIWFYLVCLFFVLIFSRDSMTINVVWVGNWIYWALKQVMTILYKSVSHTDYYSSSWSSLCCLVVGFNGVASSASVSSRPCPLLAGTFQLQLPSCTNWLLTAKPTNSTQLTPHVALTRRS